MAAVASRPGRVARFAALMLLPALAVTGCSGAAAGSAATGEERFVAGDGTVTTYATGARERVPALTGTTLAGEPFDLADLSGQVVVLNVWGSWCAPCRAEAPALERVYQATRSDGVQFVGLNVKDRAAAAEAFAERFLSYPSVDGNDGQVQLALRGVLPGAIPSTIVIDREGRLAAAAAGQLDEPALRDMVEPVAAEGP